MRHCKIGRASCGCDSLVRPPTDQIIKMVSQQREEDQRTITAEFVKISDQIAELNKIVVLLAQQVAASTGTQITSLIATPAGTADDAMAEAISSAKKQKNSDGLPSAPNITALIPPAYESSHRQPTKKIQSTHQTATHHIPSSATSHYGTHHPSFSATKTTSHATHNALRTSEFATPFPDHR